MQAASSAARPHPSPPPHSPTQLGTRNAEGRAVVSFGALYDATQDVFEALGGTLKAAKKRGVVEYSAPILLKGAHDKVPITLLVEPPEGSKAHGAA